MPAGFQTERWPLSCRNRGRIQPEYANNHNNIGILLISPLRLSRKPRPPHEQKAVVVLLALLSLGVKHIRLGPTLPAFLSPNVAKVLVENFDIKPIGTVAEDVAAIMADK